MTTPFFLQIRGHDQNYETNPPHPPTSLSASPRSTAPSYKLRPTITPHCGCHFSLRICSILPTPPLVITGSFPASASFTVCSTFGPPSIPSFATSVYKIAPSGQSLTCFAMSVARRPDDSVH